MTHNKRFIAVLLAWLAFSISGIAYPQWQRLAFEQITVANTAIGFTSTKITSPDGVLMTKAVCNLETGEVRYTIDGTTPTSTVGMIWAVNTSLTFVGHDVLSNFRAIRDSGTSGQLDCTYSAGNGH